MLSSDMACWKQTCADLAAAVANRPQIVALVGPEGAGKSYILQAFTLANVDGVAKVRFAGSRRDENVAFDLVDGFDAKTSMATFAEPEFGGTQIVAMRLEALPIFCLTHPHAPVVHVRPMAIAEIGMMIEIRRRQLRLPHDVFTLEAKLALEKLCTGNPKKLDLLIGSAERFAGTEQSPRVSADHIERAARQWALSVPEEQPSQLSIGEALVKTDDVILKSILVLQSIEPTVSMESTTPPVPKTHSKPTPTHPLFDTEPAIPFKVGSLAGIPKALPPLQELPQASSPKSRPSPKPMMTTWDKLTAPMTTEEIARAYAARRRAKRSRFALTSVCTAAIATLTYAAGAGAFSKQQNYAMSLFPSVKRSVSAFNLPRIWSSAPSQRPEAFSKSVKIEVPASVQTLIPSPVPPQRQMTISPQVPVGVQKQVESNPETVQPELGAEMAIAAPLQAPLAQIATLPPASPGSPASSADVSMATLELPAALSIHTQGAASRPIPPLQPAPNSNKLSFVLPPPPPTLDDWFNKAPSLVLLNGPAVSSLPPLSISDSRKPVFASIATSTPSAIASDYDLSAATSLEAHKDAQMAAVRAPPVQMQAATQQRPHIDDAEHLLALGRALLSIGQVNDAREMFQAAADMGNADASEAIRHLVSIEAASPNRNGSQASRKSGGRSAVATDRRQ